MKRQIQTAAILVAAGALLIGCGWLPSLILGVLDTQLLEKEQLEQLEISGPEKFQKRISTGEKLVILESQKIALKEDQKPSVQLQEVVQAQLQEYADHGLLTDEQLQLPFTWLPFVCYEAQTPERNVMTWEVVSGNGDYENLKAIGMTVDGETGQILRLSATAPGLIDQSVVSTRASEVGSIFLNQLGVLYRLTGSLSGEDSATVSYQIHDEENPEIQMGTLTVSMNPDHFQTKFEMMQH